MYVVIMVLISFLIFHASDMQTAWQDIQGLWKNQALTQASMETSAYLIRNRLGLLVIAVIGATPLANMCWQKVVEKYKESAWMSMIQCILVLLSVILCTGYLVDGSFNPFLYFRF
jgi:alginate O-acetyltransferase complex protein AlgI